MHLIVSALCTPLDFKNCPLNAGAEIIQQHEKLIYAVQDLVPKPQQFNYYNKANKIIKQVSFAKKLNSLIRPVAFIFKNGWCPLIVSYGFYILLNMFFSENYATFGALFLTWYQIISLYMRYSNISAQ